MQLIKRKQRRIQREEIECVGLYGWEGYGSVLRLVNIRSWNQNQIIEPSRPSPFLQITPSLTINSLSSTKS